MDQNNYSPIGQNPADNFGGAKSSGSKTLITVLIGVIVFLILLVAGLLWVIIGQSEEREEEVVTQEESEEEIMTIDRRSSLRKEDVSYIFRYQQIKDITIGDQEGPWEITNWDFYEGQEPELGLQSFESSLKVTFEGQVRLKGVLEHVESGYGIENEYFFRPDNDSIKKLPELGLREEPYYDVQMISGMEGESQMMFSGSNDKEKLRKVLEPNEELAAEIIIDRYSIQKDVRDYGPGFPASARLQEIVRTYPEWEEK